MKYKNAAQHLPEELLSQVQQYVDGEYLYIPRTEGNRKAWGEGTMTRRELNRRDEAICEDHLRGMSAKELADAYYLSVKSVQRILARHQKNNQT
jgi:Mor family transcriptional regulator